jgi:arginine deiminase
MTPLFDAAPLQFRTGAPQVGQFTHADPDSIDATQAAEWLPADVVLLCEPNIETLFAMLERQSANFLRPFSLHKAKSDHRRYRETIERQGAKVIDLREALVQGAEDERSPARERLKDWARGAVRHMFADDMAIADRDQVLQDFQGVLDHADPFMLVDLILLRPTVHVAVNPEALDPTTRFLARYEVAPAHNNYYTRDPLITTAVGCVIGRLSLPIRQPENDIAEYALTQLGIEPVVRVEAPGTLEGGDFIPCGDFVLQGQGLLTNAEGVRQVLDAGGYGFVEVAVVRDPRNDMDEMHLDTYFSVFDRDLCAICEERLQGQEPIVDVYEPVGTPDAFEYRLSRTEGFLSYLAGKGMKLLTFTKKEQEAFAPNGLLVGPRHFLCVKGCGDEFLAKLEAEGVRVEYLDFSALTGGYGGPHCSSQVIRRGRGHVGDIARRARVAARGRAATRLANRSQLPGGAHSLER